MNLMYFCDKYIFKLILAQTSLQKSLILISVEMFAIRQTYSESIQFKLFKCKSLKFDILRIWMRTVWKFDIIKIINLNSLNLITLNFGPFQWISKEWMFDIFKLKNNLNWTVLEFQFPSKIEGWGSSNRKSLNNYHKLHFERFIFT